MGQKVIFNMSKLGASHVKSGKPCQDYSLSWESEDKTTQVIIVCDGHGGDTYVRSDVGSRLAAEITLRNIQEFVNNTSPSLFLGKEGAVTARPAEEEDSLFHKESKSEAGLTESEMEQHAQDQAFYEAVKDIREQDYHFTRLFAGIYLQWMQAIKDDAAAHSFNDNEKSLLKTAKLVKAYGTTLIAYARTPLYWFAFQIGDGKLVCCDRYMKWTEPVPWDCNCFLNLTTSLCNSNPIPAFRYAFNGKGEFPVAVIMGSDGMDDSWGTTERLTNFYSQTLCIFTELGVEEGLKQLEEYLPRLSEKASRDDMSMAGIVDMDAIQTGVKIYTQQRELQKLEKEREQREAELINRSQTLQKLKEEVEFTACSIQKMDLEKENWWKSMLNTRTEREQVIRDTENDLIVKRAEVEQLISNLQELSNQYKEWESGFHKQEADINRICETLLQDATQQSRCALETWLQQKNVFEQSLRQSPDEAEPM